MDNILKISEQHFFDYRAENPELGVERFGPDFGLKLTEFGYNDPRQCFKRYCFGEGADIVLDYSMKRANSMGQWTCFGTPCKITNKKL